ncbi:hypothetical protein BT93_C1988 [Corymbia citriodora subsp. variegata]|nr:hypothetical protein BT93_C1988 [Corymbia citriodora subsp. variegata]
MIAYLMLHAAPFIKRIGELKLRHRYSLKLANLALTENKFHMTTPANLEYLLTSGIVLDAASRGISEIVKLCLVHFPALMWDEIFTRKLMKEVVKGRHVELFRLVRAHYLPQLTPNHWMNFSLMKAVTKLSPRFVSPDVLEDSSIPSLKSLKWQEDKKTYWENFVGQRHNLLKEAGDWMKDTSKSCSLIATLIITIAFAAVFTVPRGNNDSTGIPIFLKRSSFIIFVVADALALFSSVTATLMFLAILTSRYAIEDFLQSLPRKMILGLTFLFLSLAFMLVAFSSALTVVLSEQWKWIYIPIAILAAFPVILFTILHLPLYVQMVESTFRPRLYRT